MMYALFRVLIRILPHIPRHLVLSLGAGAGWVAWLVACKARRQARNNALHVLGRQVLKTRAGRRRLRHTVRGMFIHTVWNYLEACMLPTMSDEDILMNMQATGYDALSEGMAQGKGVVLISAHFGPFDFVSQHIAICGYNLLIPVEKLHNEQMLNLMLYLRCSHGVHYLPLEGQTTMRTIVRHLRQKHTVLITGDRSVQGETVEVSFFGAPARLPIGPVQLAIRMGAPLVAAFGWYNSDRQIRAHILPLSLALPPEQRNDVNALLHAVVRQLEAHIGDYPDQWSMFTPVWSIPFT